MANAAVISLIRSLEQLVQRKPHLISDETRRMVDSVHDSLEYFQDFLESTSKRRQKHCRKVEELEREIRMEVEKAEDVIELKIMYGIMKKKGLSKTFLRTLVGKIDATRERKAIRKTLLPFVKKIDAVKSNVMGISFGTNQVQNPDSNPHKMNLLNLDNSWKLIRDRVFGVEHACPPELEDIGEQIAQRCQGLPLALLVVAGHLSKISRTRESWNDVSKSVSKVVADESDICLGVLAMSYNYLPDHLKPCFLYMGVFPEDSVVNIVRLINLWISEGFISDELVGRDCMEDLVSRNLVMVRNRSFNGETKTCGVHDLIRDLILREAEKEKFLEVTRIHEATNPSAEKLRSTRRYCFHSHNQAAFWKLSSIIRTLHFFDGFQKLSKQVPLLVSFKLLRVLAILNDTFPTFPLEITKLVQLRYLQFTCYDNIHWSVSKLYNLQTFILGYGVAGLLPPTIPEGIWQMRNLRHLHIGDFFSFPIPSNKLQNLQELSRLALSSCTCELFSAIPNLKKLKIIGNYLMEMKRERLNSLSCLEKLEILKYRDDGIQPSQIPSKYVLPASLKRLTLSCTSLPWEDMANIITLPNLEVLKIKDNGFLGDVWMLNDEEIFKQLKFLLISWTGLKHWKAGSVNFPKLQRLFLKRCMNLEEIPQDFGDICTLESIELHKCSISAATSGKNIQEEQESIGNECLSVLIYNHP